jgi:GR25 family glycosyltransferase involved in LPS biosynthesis
MKLIAYIIYINNTDANNPKDLHLSTKYQLRKKYVIDYLLPSVKNICETKLFSAITPSKFEISETNNEILYKDKILKRGRSFHTNKFCGLESTALAISDYELFSISVKDKINVLILQDDAILPEANIQIINDSIKEFLLIEEPAFLYLQSNCPWKKNYPLKKYKKNILINHSNNLYKISHKYCGFSGNTATLFNVKASMVMLSFYEKLGLCIDDQLMSFCVKNKELSAFIPKAYDQNFLLNKQYQ